MAVEGEVRRTGARAWPFFPSPRTCLVLAALALLSSCAAKLPPPGVDAQTRFDWAQTKFDEGSYGDAARGFEDFIQREPLSPLADSALFLVAEAHLRDGDRLLAATEFTRFATTRPNNRLADDAQLGACRAYWELAPGLAHDQENTAKAIEECTRMVQFFPSSPRLGEAQELLFNARAKMAAKSYRVGKWYFDKGFFESANIYFVSTLEQFPEAPVIPELLATLYSSYRRLGFDAEAELIRDRLLADHPDSEAARRIEQPAAE